MISRLSFTLITVLAATHSTAPWYFIIVALALALSFRFLRRGGGRRGPFAGGGGPFGGSGGRSTGSSDPSDL